MDTRLAPYPPTSPDIRPSGLDALQTVEALAQNLDMEEIRAELAAAVQHIEALPTHFPDS